ncbi:hypothetical protein WOSG25_061340 [Weissella oryzae SG25]|uniref:Phage protein n=1 Tax=Weissella oryzae (strain DSM 25784 / JCM 18191 / LMG 30913 / SG25) TaxID=1329250 RepID=A0A069CU23_WEIOS|nr:tail assembly chaperone [Weissella oryzae]GAK31004.1 hypothetical protein WOSG25_061340 [Weissella oryzae SG25]
MKITLNGEEHKLNFGLRFVRELDKEYSVDMDGIKYGTGVNMVWLKLQSSDPYVMYQALRAALAGDIELTEDMFDSWVDSLEDDKAYTAFFAELMKTLETQRQTGTLVATYKKNLAKLQKIADKESKESVKVQ